MPTSALSHAANEVRRHDRDRFLAALYAPEARREAVFALLAFNIEISRIREMVREPLAGEIRLQWWRDAVDTLYAAPGEGAGSGHPVLDALAAAISAHELSRDHFEVLFDARREDFAEDGPADEAAFMAYAENSSAPLTRLILEVLAGDAARQPGGAVAAAGRHVALAWALTGLIRAIPFHARQGRVVLPADALAAAGAARDDVLRQKPTPELAAVLRPIAEAAQAHIAEARQHRRSIPKQALAALLPAVMADDYLKRLARAGYDPFDPRVARGQFGRQIKLAFSAARGAY